jgi:hypothetical protein
VERQLSFFEEDQAGLLADCDAALGSYDAAAGDQAEESYGDFVDLIDTARDELEELRDGYAGTLDQATAVEYREFFNRIARRRFPRIAAELD